jgi:heat shock protein HslJ
MFPNRHDGDSGTDYSCDSPLSQKIHPMIPQQKTLVCYRLTAIASFLAMLSMGLSPSAFAMSSQGGDRPESLSVQPMAQHLANTQRTASAKTPGGSWKLTTWTESKKPQTLEGQREVTLQLSGETVSGSASCNTYQGSLKRTGASTIQIGALATTRRLCPPEVMKQERRFLKALRAAQSMTLSSNQLKVVYTTPQGTGEMIFAAVKDSKAAPKSSLQNTNWTLLNWSLGNTLHRPLEKTEVTVHFRGDRVTGSSGCNTFGGTYRQKGTALKIRNLISTERGCEMPLMKQEAVVLAALSGSQSVALDGDGHLKVAYKSPEGSGVMTFAPT